MSDGQGMPAEMIRTLNQIQAMMADFVENPDQVPAEQLIAKINTSIDRMGFEMVRSGSFNKDL